MSEVRTLYKMGSYLYVLNGSTLIKIGTDMSQTNLGNIDTSTGPAWIKGDGTNLSIVDITKGYFYDGALQYITLPFAGAPSSLTYQDGYHIISEANSGRFFISDLYDPSVFDPLNYATKEGFMDNLRSVYSHNRDLWLLGEDTLEVWYNSGDVFPFTRYQGGFINIGCKAGKSVASDDMYIFWLDNNLRVRRGSGVQSEIISTTQIDYQIYALTGHTEAIGFCYFQEGHGFYQLTIADKTFVYDVTTGFWHTRASGTNNNRHPAQCYAFFNDKHLIGHYSDGKIYYFDLNAYDNGGEMMRAIRAAQVIHDDEKKIFHGKLQIEFESGVGGVGIDANAILDWSDDGGHTWSNPYTVSIGASGEYAERAIWRRLGSSRNRIYRVTIEDSVKKVITGASLDAMKGNG